jgi:hypothetical protein
LGIIASPFFAYPGAPGAPAVVAQVQNQAKQNPISNQPDNPVDWGSVILESVLIAVALGAFLSGATGK